MGAAIRFVGSHPILNSDLGKQFSHWHAGKKLSVPGIARLRDLSRTPTNRDPMKKHISSSIAIIATVAISIFTVHAANVHFKSAPKTTDNGTTATVCATLTGLGNGDLTITLIGSGIRSTSCLNPAGNFAPGNPGQVAVGGVTTVPASEIKNGNVSFCVTTESPECASANACGCPNNNWAATVTDVDFTSLTLVVEQGGKVVLQQTVK